MVEHTPWKGLEYSVGLEGRRVAIVGYSHWLDDGYIDNAEATKECVSKIISGAYRIAFFTSIRNYFGYESHEAFWQRVMFFNYLPECVGHRDRRFNHGTPEQIRAAKTRFLRLIGEELPPQTVLIFTGRHWAFPDTDSPPQELGPDFPRFWYGQYTVNGHHAAAFFLRHPQGASGTLMRRVVTQIRLTRSR